MSDFELLGEYHLLPTPAGAYHAVSRPEADPARETLLRMLSADATPRLTETSVGQITGREGEEGMELLHHLQSLEFIQGLEESRRVPEGTLDTVLTKLVRELAGDQQALLADTHGLQLANQGFEHDIAEALSALSADIGTLQSRHHRLLAEHMGVDSHNWALVNAGGNSELGFWPLFIGAHRFVLILSGLPNLNQPALVDLAWVLTQRYGESPA